MPQAPRLKSFTRRYFRLCEQPSTSQIEIGGVGGVGGGMDSNPTLDTISKGMPSLYPSFEEIHLHAGPGIPLGFSETG